MAAFYLISVKHEDLGKSPQGKVIPSDLNSFNNIFYHRIFQYGKLPDKLPINYSMMAYHAKWTDFLYLNGIPNPQYILILNNVILEIFETFKIPPYQVWRYLLVQKNHLKKNYNLFYLNENSLSVLDFKKTNFFITPSSGKNPEQVELNSILEYEEKRKQLSEEFEENPKSRRKIIRLYSPVFKTDVSYDLFRIGGPINGYFISEELKNALVNARCTGLKFIPVADIQNIDIG